MRAIAALLAVAMLAGCANEYSKVPEPTGEWISANPPSLTAVAAPAPPPPRRVWHRRPARRPAPVHTAAAAQ